MDLFIGYPRHMFGILSHFFTYVYPFTTAARHTNSDVKNGNVGVSEVKNQFRGISAHRADDFIGFSLWIPTLSKSEFVWRVAVVNS